jgi:UDP-N-acetyl-D-mannosaminuronate dehydrogenase
LAKNPAGWAEVFDMLSPAPAPVVIAINARTADGHDPSWLWDVPFELLRGRAVTATGERGLDLAVRLHYAEVDHTVAPSVSEALRAVGAQQHAVGAQDPMVRRIEDVDTVDNFYDVANGADAVVLATEWPQYLSCDLAVLSDRMRGTLFFDGRNAFDPAAVRSVGLRYVGVGRGLAQAGSSQGENDQAIAG